MNPAKNKTIAIIGGGPGGLTLARLLQQKGVAVKVYERDENRQVRVQGATLDLHEDSGLEALRQAGLMNAFLARYRPGADRLTIADKQGNIYMEEHAGEEGGEAYRPEIDRGPLRDILLDALQPDTVVWDSHCISISKTDGRWNLIFRKGTAAAADIVIAADGANSGIRPWITDIKPFFSGITMVEGAVYDAEKNVPEIHRMLNGGKLFILGDAKTLIISSKGDGSLVFYTGCRTEEGWVRSSGIDFGDKEQVLEWFRREFSGWNALWNELFRQAKPPFIPRPQYCMPVDQDWKALPDLTLLGDAAHLMPPFAGEGVNMAMQDALELSLCLTGDFPDTLAAIGHYERQMRRRASAVAQMTLEQTESLHSEKGLENLVAMFSAHP